MKTLFKPLVALLFAASIVSCSNSDQVVDEQIVEGDRPFADFEIVPTEDPFTFNFINKAENYKTLEWRFGDDSLGTDTTKSHLYMVPGDYEVSMTAISETGSTAKKVLLVKIDPDSVAQIIADKTGTQNEVKFKINTKADIASVLWKFDGGAQSTELEPQKTYAQGTLNPLSLTLTTKKGAVLTLDKFATTEGVVSNVTNKVSLNVSADNSGGAAANEGSLKIIDNDVETKLYMGWPGSFWAQFAFQAPTEIKFYGIGSANDYGTRGPKDWTLEGSNDGTSWEVLDTRSEIAFGDVFKTMFYYPVANPKPFLYYRWNVTANNGDGGFQISEFRLFK